MSKETLIFGNSDVFVVESMRPVSDVTVEHTDIAIDRASNSETAYQACLQDIAETLTTITDEQTGQQFEIAVANKDATDDTVDAEISTFASSISKGLGNAIEFAEHAALNPSRRRLYIASLGNGGSSYWTTAERKYVSREGRFTDPDGKPLPTIAALGRALLTREDLVISRLSTNSAGGAYATALMTALPEGQVSHAYFKSRPNVSNHPMRAGWGIRFMLTEQAASRAYADYTEDPWRMTDERRADARTVLRSVYGEDGGTWSHKNALKQSPLPKLWADTNAFSHQGAAEDTVAALQTQPEARLTFHFPESDTLYRNLRTDVTTFLTRTAVGDQVTGDQLEALVMPGTHHDHSAYPTLRWSIENYAFGK